MTVSSLIDSFRSKTRTSTSLPTAQASAHLMARISLETHTPHACSGPVFFQNSLEQLTTTFLISISDKIAAQEVESVESTFTQKPVKIELFIWKTIHEQYFVQELLLVEP